MPGGFSITSRTTGETLTATKYNSDRQEIVDHLEPAYLDDYSSSTSQMRTQTDPGESGSESLPTTIAGELERMRYRLAEIAGMTYWYQTGTGVRAQSIATASVPAAATAGRLMRLSDGKKGLWMDNGTLWVPLHGVVNVAEWATGGAGTLASPWTGWESATTAARDTTYYFQPGVYSTATFQNFNAENITVIADNVLLKFTGTGNAFGSDVGSGGAAIYNFTQKGKLTIQGNANCTNCVYFRGSHHIDLDKIRAHDCTNAGLLTQWVVGLHAKQFIVSSGQQKPWTTGTGYTTTPNYGIQLDERSAGYYTAVAHFDDVIIENVTLVGIDIIKGRDILFSTGTSEGNAIGFRCRAGANRVTINSMDFESNTQNDAVFDGTDAIVIGSNFQSAGSGNTIEVSTGQRTQFHGGYVRLINLQGTSADTRFFGTIFEDNPALGIQGTGTYKTWGVIRTTGSYTASTRPADHIADQATFTPTLVGSGTAGTFTYTTRTGAYCRIGQLVQCSIVILLSAMAVAPVGTMTITGLPFTSDSSYGTQGVTVNQWGNVTLGGGYTQLGGYIGASSTVITLTESGSGVAAVGLPAGGIAANSELILNFTYTAVQN